MYENCTDMFAITVLFRYSVYVWIPRPRLHFVLHAFFFFVQPAIVDKSTMNSARCALFTNSQITLFNHFFIKNRSHNIIHIFKNYFATVFLVFSFQLYQTDPPSLFIQSSYSSHIYKYKTNKIVQGRKIGSPTILFTQSHFFQHVTFLHQQIIFKKKKKKKNALLAKLLVGSMM